MDTENLLLKFAAFTAEVCIASLLYRQYKSYSNCLKSLKEAKCLELDGELKNTVEMNSGEIKYAVIQGKVKALTSPLNSQYVPYLAGVIREKITVEKKLKWNPFLGIWGSANNDLMQTINYVPFSICAKSGSLFKKSISVEVLEPLESRELLVPTVYDEFTCHHDSIGDAVFGVIRGEKTLGIQEVEKLLCENETLTAVGKLVIENNKLKIKPPDEGLVYFLTPLSFEALMNKISVCAKVYKVTTIIIGAVGMAFFVYFSRCAFKEIKRKINHSRERKRFEEERKQRRMADKNRKQHDANLPKCVVCLDNPVEILILECGHACLCYDCSDQVRDSCPYCRKPIKRKVSAFWP